MQKPSVLMPEPGDEPAGLPTEIISTVFARLLVRNLKREGFDEAVLFQGVTISADALQIESAITIADMNQLMSNACGLVSPSHVAFFVADRNVFLGMERLGVAMAVAPTALDGLRVLGSYTRIASSFAKIDVQIDSTTTLAPSYSAPLGALLGIYERGALALIQGYCEYMLCEAMPDARFFFTHPEPRDHKQAPSHLRGEVNFEQARSKMEVSTEPLRAPSPYYDQLLWQRSLDMLSESLRELGEHDHQLFSTFIYNSLKYRPPPIPSSAQLAQHLNMSTRTLSRRLKREGTSFRSIRRTVQNELAHEFLGETKLSVEAISMLLGYQDVSSFRRAFVNENGHAPSHYRGGSR